MTPVAQKRLGAALSLSGVLLVVAGVWLVVLTRQAPDDARARGKRLYLEGVLPSGQPLEGVAQVGVWRVGPDAACVACHRRSGFGTSEGSVEIRSITGPDLFGKPARPDPVRAASSTERARAALLAGRRPRPVYDAASLARALRDGVDVTGRKLDPAMPRYSLDDAALASLSAFLHTLSAAPSPGITEDAIHFATVIQPGVDPQRRRAMLEVLQAFFDDKNAGMQAEQRQERAGYKHLGRTHRRWVLHVWELRGPSEAWPRQLEARARQQPAFALISGLGDLSWRPIHEFSERFEVPCIFPLTDVPVVSEPGEYTVYFSRGVVLEAEALARHLRDQGDRAPVVQVYRRDDASSAAAAAFRNAWTRGAVQERVVDAVPDEAFWRQLAAEAPGATLVLWLPASDLVAARALDQAGAPFEAVYLSATLSAGHPFVEGGEGRVRLVYPQDLPDVRGPRLQSVTQWMRARGLALTHEKVQMNTFLAARLLAEVMEHGADTLSRDFLLESLEHVVGNNLAPTIYPRLSLAPGQRFASKGSYITTPGARGEALSLVSDWIVP